VTAVDPLFAQWLQADGLWFVGEDSSLKARWGDAGAVTSQRMTTIASAEDVQLESGRQLAFFGGPIVVDEHLLQGEWADCLGRVITLTIAQLGYDAGLDVFVIGVQDERATGNSRVTVLRRL
jgi:hypothetical protein